MAGTVGFTAGDALALLDWKHRIFELYVQIRSDPDPRRAWGRWCDERDRLFLEHPQSPLTPDAQHSFSGCSYFDYDPAFRVAADVVDVDPRPAEVPVSTDDVFRFTRVGVVRFMLQGVHHELELDWNEGYGGGLFLAFHDLTSGTETYGGGRYLLDTVKGSELGFDVDGRTLVLDFNFAYNPSCAYDARWACPLAPAANALPIDVSAGERTMRLAGDAHA
jgi:uncharacterized protein